ncbi:MAG: hypothetical protein EA350_03485 [Gemmatimonadales bacterium]|nr:MAG: hypothetical protein EA350_03485 [Gemmatimonadales bacterium]
MYRHCPSCTRDLGANEALESFPVGRRLAFDLERGRLWVLCPRCRAWNLAPIEERWEAVEEAEIRFQKAEQGLATEHVALGRLADGTELIRIGGAAAPELAGWRYARRIEGRFRKHRRVGGLMATGFVLAGPMGLGVGLFPFVLAGALGYSAVGHLRKRGRRLEFEGIGDAGGPPRVHRLDRNQLRNLHLVPLDDEAGPDGWGLEVRDYRGALVVPRGLRNRALRMSLLELNHDIGNARHLEKALDRVVKAGDPERLGGLAARAMAEGKAWESHVGWPFGDQSALNRADPVLRLALEIAANDEVERVALEGELHLLELEWREAEELAAISDDLLVPEWVRRRIEGWRGGGG